MAIICEVLEIPFTRSKLKAQVVGKLFIEFEEVHELPNYKNYTHHPCQRLQIYV